MFVFYFFVHLAEAGSSEKALVNRILKNYQLLERPVALENDTVQLTFGVSLKQLIDLDEKNQLLAAHLWFNFHWHDYNLAWNKSEFGGIDEIRLPTHLIWTPDVLLYNSASPSFDTSYQVNVVVSYDGNCTYLPPAIVRSTCQIDITWFPFDDQFCILKFGSWTYPLHYLNMSLEADKADLSDFSLNGEWEVLGMPGVRSEFMYECCKDTIYVDIIYTIHMRRRTMYYFANLILPCVLIASMSILGFYFPPDSGEKITLEITILMSLTFFMNMVTDMQPPSSETPLIGIYFSCIMIMVASSVVCTILVMNYHHRASVNNEMPAWFRALFLQWFPWILMMSKPGSDLSCKAISLQNKIRQLEKEDRSSKSLMTHVLELDDLYPFDSCAVPEGPFDTSTFDTFYQSTEVCPPPPPPPPQSANEVESDLKDILAEIRTITDKIKEEKESSDVENEWKFAAMVLDRICLIAFTIFTIILSAAVFLTAPHVIVW